MTIQSLFSFRFAFAISFSFAASSYSTTKAAFSPNFLPVKSHSTPATPPVHKATASDLLSILGTPQQASSVNPTVAKELRSCLKFLVPFSPNQLRSASETPILRRELSSKSESRSPWSEQDKLVWWPPAPVMELARLAVDSGGDPDAIYRALDPTMIPVPDVEKSNKNKCQLTRTPYGRHFINEVCNGFKSFDSGRLGILFHAKEYPMYDKKVFPHNMGYCQKGSNVVYDKSMNLRNILWLAPLPSTLDDAWSAPGVLVVLDASPGGIIYRDIVPEYVDDVRTIYEADFGDVVADVNYLNVGETEPDYQIFIC